MKLRVTLLCLVLLALTVAPAAADIFPIDIPGQLQLAWNDCMTGGGAPTIFVVCQDPAASDQLFASLISGPPIPGIIADLGIVDVTAGLDPLNLPPYWNFSSVGCSGPSNLVFSNVFITGPFNCFDLWGGLGGTGGQFGGETTPIPVGNRARIKWTTATTQDAPVNLPGGVPTYIERMTFRHGGLSACPGCMEPVCFVYNEERFIDLSSNTWRITNPGFATANTSPTAFDCPGSTPNKAKTWGQVKTLYR